MAQINISHFTDIAPDESLRFAVLARDIVAREVHGLEESEIQPDSVTVLVIPIDQASSLSGADTELHLFISGNDWPLDSSRQPATPAEAKKHFDRMAKAVYDGLVKSTKRKIYIWVTPFTATGWAEG